MLKLRPNTHFVKFAPRWDEQDKGNVSNIKGATREHVKALALLWAKGEKLPAESTVKVIKGIHQENDLHFTACVIDPKGKEFAVEHIAVEKIPTEEGKESKANGKSEAACPWRLVTEAPAKPAKPLKPAKPKPAWEPTV